MAASFRPRLAYVVNSLNLGGTESLVVQMSEAFGKTYDVVVICLDEPGLWADELRQKGIPVYCVWRQPGLDLKTAFRIARLARALDIQIIHAHQCTPWFYGALSRIFFGRPRLLFEEHGRFYPEVKNWKKNIINRLVIQPLTSMMVAVSEDVKKRLNLFEGVSLAPIRVVYNGTHPCRKFSPYERQRLRQELGFSESDFVIGSVGRIDPIKNYGMFVESLGEVCKQLPNVKGLLVGNGPEFSFIRSLGDSLGLERILKMPGYRNDADSIIQGMDLFILCSHSEGTSMALLESMAAEVPVIVTEVGGNPEVVHRDLTGWVVSPGAREELTAAIFDVLKNSEKAKQFMDEAKNRYQEKFTFQRMIGQYGQIYADLLKKH